MEASFTSSLMWETLGWEWCGQVSVAPWVSMMTRQIQAFSTSFPQAFPRPAQETQVCGISKIRCVVLVFVSGLQKKMPMRSLQILEIPRNLSEFCVKTGMMRLILAVVFVAAVGDNIGNLCFWNHLEMPKPLATRLQAKVYRDLPWQTCNLY